MEKSNIDGLLNELYSFSMHGIKLGLTNIKEICNKLGDPQNSCKIIHIAGTNGKGSVTTTLERILLEAGYSVGKYTSPHILKFNERISFNGIDISSEDIAHYYELVKKAIKEANVTPTFFEVTTAMMFKYFADKKADYIVLETGMGGRFDATNIANDSICIITNVTLEHTEYLGDTIYKISCEKAGIIKNCKKIIVCDNDPDFLSAINEGRTKDSVLCNVLDKYKDATFELDFTNFKTNIKITDSEEYEFSLFGDYQFKNFLCAYECARELGISQDIIKRAVNKVVWQCRMERWSTDPLVILDGAHNKDGMTELMYTINKGYKPSEIVIINSILKDKNIHDMVALLEKMSDKIIFTEIGDNPRGQKGEDIAKYISNIDKCVIENDIKKAYEIAISYNKKMILLCGSFYLLSLFKEKLGE